MKGIPTSYIRILTIVLLLVGCSTDMAAQYKVKPYAFSLWEPISFPKWDSMMINNVSIGLLQSKNGFIHGANINTLIGRSSGNVKGVALSGLANITRKDMNGFQASSIWNNNFGNTRGVQLSAFSNMTIGKMKGFQLGGAFNFVAGNLSGVQISGLTNVVGMNAYGMQISPILNLTLNSTVGTQVGALNFSEELHGLQIGAINLTGKGSGKILGAQVGLINYSADTSAIQVGLVNATPQTKIQMIVYGGNMYYGGAAIKFKNPKAYNIIGFGAPYTTGRGVYSGAIIYRSGYYATLFKRIEVSADAGIAYISITNTNPEIIIPKDLLSIQFRGNIEYRFSKRLGLFGTVGWARDSRWFEIETYRTKGFVEMGVSLF